MSGNTGRDGAERQTERGQGTIEYTGLAVVAAVILGFLIFSGAPSWATSITDSVQRIICGITEPVGGGGDCGDEQNPVADDGASGAEGNEDVQPETLAAPQGEDIPDDRLDQERVDRAAELFENAISEDATGEDIRALREHLADLSPAEIQELARQHPDINRYSLPVPRTAEDLASFPDGHEGSQWWNESLTDEQREAMEQYMPLVVGNTEGVDYETRSEANLNALAFLRGHEGTTDAQMEHLDQIAAAMLDDEGRIDENKYLMSLHMGHPRENGGAWYNPGDWFAGEEKHWPDPLAAISVGNPDTADTASFNISGMSSSTETMPTKVRRAEGLYDGLDDSHAQISWVGYHPPPSLSPSVWSDGRAEEGGYALAYAVDGYQQTRSDATDDPGVFLNCHSYGTNTCNHALMNNQETVDGVTMYGSSGIPKDLFDDSGLTPAEQLNVGTYGDDDAPAVFATISPNDWVAGIGRNPLGAGFISRYNPADDAEYGAQSFYSDGQGGNIDGEAVHGHGQNEYGHPERYGYLDPDSQSYETIIMILQGQADEVEFR